MTVAEAFQRIGDDPLQAWVALDRSASPAVRAGPLFGMPFGVKDVIDVEGLETGLGLDDKPPTAEKDAWCVMALKAAGAVPIGKTRTTPYQLADPTSARHPQHPDRTPGGSSVGSAVAIGAGHVPFALGAQTLGSILKPASFCGVVGYKPSYGTIPSAGVFPLAPSLDHVGVLARDVVTTIAVMECFGLQKVSDTKAPSVGYDPEYFREHFPEEVRQKYTSLIDLIREHGAKLSSASTGVLHEIVPVGQTIHGFEGHLVLREKDLRYPNLRAYVEKGATITPEEYHCALVQRGLLARKVQGIFNNVDILVLPAADSPPTRETTGNSIPFSPSTFFGLPAISLPAGTFADGTPFAIQCVGPRGRDMEVLSVSVWLEAALSRSKRSAT